MFKSESQRIVRRILLLVVLLVCLGATANTRTTPVAAAAACPSWQEWECYNNGGAYFNPFHCSCSYYEDIYACEQAGGTWNYHVAQCDF